MSRYRVTPNRQIGVSLVELMISITIGIVIALAVISAYLGASGAGRVAEAQGRMNEDAQMALNIIAQQVRMAGSNPERADRAVGALQNPISNVYANPSGVGTGTITHGIRGCDVTFGNVLTATNMVALTCGHASNSTGPGSIAIGYEADVYNTAPSVAGGVTPTDCVGTALPSVSQNVTTSGGVATTTLAFEAENRFYIGTSAGVITAPSLYCKGSASTTTVVVENIEDLEISYGMVTTTPSVTATVGGYLDAYDVENFSSAPLTGMGQAARWGWVRTVRICVVARTADPVATSNAAAQYYQCDGTTLVTPTDLRLRRAYTTTVVLRNQ